MASLVYAAGPNLDLIASILLQPLHKNRNIFQISFYFQFFSEAAAKETASRSHAHGAIIASLAAARSTHNLMNIGGPRRALKYQWWGRTHAGFLCNCCSNAPGRCRCTVRLNYTLPVGSHACMCFHELLRNGDKSLQKTVQWTILRGEVGSDIFQGSGFRGEVGSDIFQGSGFPTGSLRVPW